jgi:hypothetical protein
MSVGLSSSFPRNCTCHPDEAPIPCQHKCAFSECVATLLAKQQPLGKDFEKVLYDNLWSLYVRS